jgi:hypothetical protein
MYVKSAPSVDIINLYFGLKIWGQILILPRIFDKNFLKILDEDKQ